MPATQSKAPSPDPPTGLPPIATPSAAATTPAPPIASAPIASPPIASAASVSAATAAGTLHDALDVAAARHPDAPLVFPSADEMITLRVLAETSRTIAASLVADGVEPGDRVGVLAQNSAEFLLAVFAVSRTGAAACPLPLPTSAHDLGGYAERMARTAAVAGIQRVVTGARVSAILSRIADKVGDLRFLPAGELARGNAPDPTGPGTAGRTAAGRPRGGSGPTPGGGGHGRGGGGRPLPACPVTADDAAIVQFTSGSTAAPKGVVLSHRNVLCGISAIIDGIGLGQGDHGGIWLPLFHDMGLFATLSAIMTGIPMTVWSPTSFVRDPGGWLRTFLASGATISPAPNFAYDELVQAIGPDEVAVLDMRRWRVALNGAEPVSALGVERFLEHFGPAGFAPEAMFPVYGMAEATLAVTFPPLGRPPMVLWVDRDRLAADATVVEVAREHSRAKGLVGVGRPVREMRVRVADPRADVLADPRGDGLAPSLRVGEIQIQGGSVTSGYLTAAGGRGGPFTADGWLRTGDVGFRRGDELFVTGRDKEMIIVRGVNYYPEDAEHAVRDLPGLHRRRVVAFGGGSDCGRSDGERSSGGGSGGRGSSGGGSGGRGSGAESGPRVDRGESITLVGETALTEPADQARLAADLRAAATAALGVSAVAVRLVAPGTLPRTSSGKFQRLAVRDLIAHGLL